jgi:hypothetical protein
LAVRQWQSSKKFIYRTVKDLDDRPYDFTPILVEWAVSRARKPAPWSSLRCQVVTRRCPSGVLYGRWHMGANPHFLSSIANNYVGGYEYKQALKNPLAGTVSAVLGLIVGHYLRPGSQRALSSVRSDSSDHRSLAMKNKKRFKVGAKVRILMPGISG